ncbi:hypothetical protein P8879_04180 [Bacillus spizizenii]|nr:hypothetical protein [Bacillus spizizenii]MCY7839619.1 hypothetical protein [Bacillus spizizenii]MCY9314177.1 hypothetical protein [Bacillus spizizenii]MEC0560911.1 hypothetical protein [Bacillus spizizenii]
MKQKSIYVEIEMRSDLDKLWAYTQNPSLHKEWDLRFSNITYLHRQPYEKQKFLYETRIGFGLKVSGTGETVGVFDKCSSERVSSLAFGSDHPLSLIQHGSGYWKYIQRDNGKLTFLTQYQYKTAYGLPGRWIDRLLFRPLLGWATAWSFDVLRLWIEQNKHPKYFIRSAIVYVLMCLFFSLFWMFQGFTGIETNILAGTAEIGLGILWLIPLKRKWIIHVVQACLFAGFAILGSEIVLWIPLSVFSAASGILSLQLPSARHTKRKRKK